MVIIQYCLTKRIRRLEAGVTRNPISSSLPSLSDPSLIPAVLVNASIDPSGDIEINAPLLAKRHGNDAGG